MDRANVDAATTGNGAQRMRAADRPCQAMNFRLDSAAGGRYGDHPTP
jgi:hypothetical protein